jgi:hypothetical protein
MFWASGVLPGLVGYPNNSLELKQPDRALTLNTWGERRKFEMSKFKT